MIDSGIPCLNLPVYTVSGQHLGRIVGVEVEAGGQRVVRYQVASTLPLARLWGEKILISPAQVVSVTDKVMTVIDAVVGAKAAAKSRPNLAPEPTA